MRITVTEVNVDPAELAPLRAALGLDVIEAALTDIKEGQAAIMADFTQLNAALEEHATATTDATARVAEDVQALRDQIEQLNLDTADQEAVNAATAKVQASVSALQAIDPVPPVEPPVDPEEPGDGGGGEEPVNG